MNLNDAGWPTHVLQPPLLKLPKCVDKWSSVLLKKTAINPPVRYCLGLIGSEVDFRVGGGGEGLFWDHMVEHTCGKVGVSGNLNLAKSGGLEGKGMTQSQ